jgi:hypothetical protein
MAMQMEGQSLRAIRMVIDEKYGPMGRPTLTPQPPG